MAESDEQKIVVQFFRLQYPQHALALSCSQSGGMKGKGRAGAIRQSIQKAMGATTGEADLRISLPRGGFGTLFIELKKTGDKKGPTDEQIAFNEYHNKNGNCAVVAVGEDVAIAAIKTYMNMQPNEAWSELWERRERPAYVLHV